MKHLATWIGAALLVAACGSGPPRPRTVAEFLDDPALLQGVMLRCKGLSSATRDPECANAFAATERIASEEEAKRAGARASQFERQRESLRSREDAARAAAERANPKFDPYSTPVAPEGADAAGAGTPAH